MAILQIDKRGFGIFLLRMRRNGYFGVSGQIWPRHSLRWPRFLARQMHFHYRVTFIRYIWCFCTTTLCELVTMTFDLLTLTLFHILYLTSPTQTLTLIILRLSVTHLWITEFDHISVSGNSDLSLGDKNDTHFWHPWPKFTYSLCHFHSKPKIKPCYRRK